MISKDSDFKFIVKVAKVLGGEHVPELSVGPSKVSNLSMLLLSVSKCDFFRSSRDFSVLDRAVHSRALEEGTSCYVE